MDDQWIRITSVKDNGLLKYEKGFLRMSDIHKFIIKSSSNKYWVEAVVLQTASVGTPVSCAVDSSKDAMKCLEKILRADPKYVVKFGKTKSSHCELMEEIAELKRMIMYLPGGQVYNESEQNFTKNIATHFSNEDEKDEKEKIEKIESS